MWFKKCFYIECLVFSILVVKADSVDHNESYRKNLGSELVKNITEVNKTLKDLIKNYKYLENIYKTDEKLQSDSSGSEIDEKFKEMKRKRKEQKRSQKEGPSTASLNTIYQGTAYIFESRTSDELQSKDIKEEDEKGDLETDQNKGINMEELSPDEKKSGSESSEEEEEMSEDIEEIEIDIPKTKPQNTPRIRTIKPQKLKNDFGKKTRFNVLHDGQEDNVTKRDKSDTLKVRNQRIVYSEQFPPQTFWKDIVNRPIKLNRVISAEEIASLKDDNEDKIRALPGNTKKNDNDTLTNQTSKNATDDSPLRSYGDACLEMPIKKCKKALKTVNKNVCKMRFKCKSEFKSDFIRNSERGCEKKYMYNVEDSEETTTVTTKKDNKDADDADDAGEDENNTRRRNGDSKLKSGARHKHSHPSTEKQPVTTFRNDFLKSSLHPSLRDKYEKECQKELRAKCVGAGNYAVKKTCAKHECDEKKEKALTKACKKECKNAFAIDKNSSGSSDDGSESDSDSEE